MDRYYLTEVGPTAEAFLGHYFVLERSSEIMVSHSLWGFKVFVGVGAQTCYCWGVVIGSLFLGIGRFLPSNRYSISHHHSI